MQQMVSKSAAHKNW